MVLISPLAWGMNESLCSVLPSGFQQQKQPGQAASQAADSATFIVTLVMAT